MTAFPKRQREENPHLRRMARKHGCSMLWAPGCRGDETSTTVLAHANGAWANKGMGMKAHDFLGVYACMACHVELDQGRRHTAEQKAAAFRRGLANQAQLYRRILESSTAKPEDHEAAAWAVTRLADYLQDHSPPMGSSE